MSLCVHVTVVYLSVKYLLKCSGHFVGLECSKDPSFTLLEAVPPSQEEGQLSPTQGAVQPCECLARGRVFTFGTRWTLASSSLSLSSFLSSLCPFDV